MKQVDHGIFLSKTPYSSSSLIVTFYTRKFGLKKFIFKGGKKKSHNLYPLSISEITFYGRQETSLLSLTEASPMIPLSFQFNPIKSVIAFFIAEVILKCSHTDNADESAFDFFSKQIITLDEVESCSLFPIQFLVLFTEKLGIQPFIKEVSSPIFNLEEGIIEKSDSQLTKTEHGDHVQLIVDLYQRKSIETSNQQTREKALETMMDYYRIHLSKVNSFETYQIVKEVVND